MQDDPWLTPELSEDGVLAYASQERMPEPEVPDIPRFAAFMSERVVERPLMPDTVRNAVALMFAGMTLTIAQMVAAIIDDASAGGSIIESGIAVTLTEGLIMAAMWYWMAATCREGRHWARVLSSIFFAVKSLATAMSMVIGLHYPPLFVVLDLMTEAVGLVAIVLLWHGRSDRYFRPAPGYSYES